MALFNHFNPSQIMALRAETAHDYWYDPRKPTHTVVDRMALFDFVTAHLGAETDIRYLEFGVAAGWSINRIASIFKNPNARFVGFDSFEGLPESWSNLTPGTFSTGGQAPAIIDSRVEFVKGWFQNTVGDYLARLSSEPKKIPLVHFDADLYSSTLFLLTSLWWHIPEYFFIFDELIGEELVALHDFAAAYPTDIEFYTVMNNKYDHPFKVFGRLRATQMSVNLPAKEPAPAPV